MIDIAGLNKATLLLALYDFARGDPGLILNEEEINRHVEKRQRLMRASGVDDEERLEKTAWMFDDLCDVKLGVSLGGDVFAPGVYDAMYGKGEAARVVAEVREQQDALEATTESVRVEFGPGQGTPPDPVLEQTQRRVAEMEENDIQDHVREFMTVMQPDMVPCGVTIPHTGVLELRLKLVMEEAIELMEACGCGGDELDNARNHVMGIIQTYTERKNVDLPKLVDALADLDYVIEGFRITLGVDGRPIARAVHAANMAKTTGPVRADGKRLKPEGWKEPDIVGELRRQGWVG